MGVTGNCDSIISPVTTFRSVMIRRPGMAPSVCRDAGLCSCPGGGHHRAPKVTDDLVTMGQSVGGQGIGSVTGGVLKQGTGHFVLSGYNSTTAVGSWTTAAASVTSTVPATWGSQRPDLGERRVPERLSDGGGTYEAVTAV